MVLNFSSIRNKQLLCGKCGKYYPMEFIVYWNNCNHTFCNKCFMGYIKAELTQNKIPKCDQLNSNCNQELTTANLKRFRTENSNWDLLVKQMDRFCYLRARFKCSMCKRLHLNEDKFSWSICGHEYGKECAKMCINRRLLSAQYSYMLPSQNLPKCHNLPK